MKKYIKNSEKGSVLMEFVLVLPVYIATIGGILWLGLSSLDAISLRAVDHWGVWMAGNRFSFRTPAVMALQDMFPRSNIIITSQDRALVDKHSYLQFIGSKTTISHTRPDYIDNWLNMPYTMSGESKPWSIPEFQMTSSRYDNSYTQCIIMKSKGSLSAKRHWHASLLADQKIWKFSEKSDEYPSKWEYKLLENAKNKNDDEKNSSEPKKIEFYTRYPKYVEWSAKK